MSGPIKLGTKIWRVPSLPPGDTPVVSGVDEDGSFSMNMAVTASERCPRCGKVTIGEWVSSDKDGNMPNPKPPPEHSQEECDSLIVKHVHDR